MYPISSVNARQTVVNSKQSELQSDALTPHPSSSHDIFHSQISPTAKIKLSKVVGNISKPRKHHNHVKSNKIPEEVRFQFRETHIYTLISPFKGYRVREKCFTTTFLYRSPRSDLRLCSSSNMFKIHKFRCSCEVLSKKYSLWSENHAHEKSGILFNIQILP